MPTLRSLSNCACSHSGRAVAQVARRARLLSEHVCLSGQFCHESVCQPLQRRALTLIERSDACMSGALRACSQSEAIGGVLPQLPHCRGAVVNGDAFALQGPPAKGCVEPQRR